MGKSPARTKKGARRLNATPELMTNIRHRYEHSDERLATMAADLGCCGETVRAIGKREGWVRYEPPPRDLSPAARLRGRVEALSPLIPAQAGIQGHTEEPCQAAPGSPLARGRADDVSHAQENSHALHAATTEQMLREVAGFLDDVRAERKRMKREGYAKHELQATSRVIHDISASLQRLKPLAHTARPIHDSETAQENAYDDIPADLDSFREDLARQIDALLEEPPDEGDSAPASAAEAAPPPA